MKKLVLFCLAGGLALAAQAKDPVFAAASQTRSDQILKTPPANDAAATRAELAELHRIEESRTPAQVARAQDDEALETLFVYRDVLGDRLDPAKLPLTALLAGHVKNDEGINSGPAKLAFHRIRPYNLDKSLHPVCKTKTKDDSYPSGHATSGYLNALVLVDMLPEKRDAILARADDYAHNRLVCGVHYASDIEASKLVSYATHAVMSDNPQYQKEMAAARSELRKALGLPD